MELGERKNDISDAIKILHHHSRYFHNAQIDTSSESQAHIQHCNSSREEEEKKTCYNRYIIHCISNYIE